MIFETVALISSIISAVLVVYIEWIPEDERSGHVVRQGGSLREALGKLDKPFKSDRWYIKQALAFLAICTIFQLLAIFVTI